MEFNYIVNPETGRKVSIYGKTGQRVLNNYMHNGGAMRSGSRIPADQYQVGGAMRSGSRIPAAQYQVGGAMRSGSRIPAAQYQVGGGTCKKFRKTKDPKCDEQPGCHWEVGNGCQGDLISEDVAPVVEEEGLTAAQKKQGEKYVSGINEMWKAIREAGITLHGNEFFYMEDPDHWRYPPAVLLAENNSHSLSMLESNYNDTIGDFNKAKADLKKAAKPEAPKPKKTSGCKQYKKTKDPKCNDQPGCHWETGKGCLDTSGAQAVVVRAPMKPSAEVKPTGKKVKKVTTKAHGTTMRLSAGEYYRSHGNDKSLGDRCDIRKNDEYRCLLKRSNGTAYWAKKSKSGAGQEACGDWSSRCKEPAFA